MSNSYGINDNSYQAAGGLDGITRLVNDFYDRMDEQAMAAKIRAMHPKDLGLSREKLIAFLSGWLGGPRLYPQRFGSISIPKIHAPLHIDEADRDAWLACMDQAIDQQDYKSEFKAYLKAQFRIPAERILAAGRGAL